MQKRDDNQFYTSGEFAKKAHVTLRTIRYYDSKGLLVPSQRADNGTRFYTEDDFARLQQILLLKYLGFSLEDIREMTLASADPGILNESLKLQKQLLRERIAQIETMTEAIDQTSQALEHDRKVDWDNMLRLIHLTAMERELKEQYQNATNINARISLHRDYSVNKQGWFPWVFENLDLHPGMRVLEVGCGNGELWTSTKVIPSDVDITVTDISEGMVREVARTIGGDDRFTFEIADIQDLPYADGSFDLVIANHVLFYASRVPKAIRECRRVLRPRGRLIASTYGPDHMKEITQLVQKFNPEIVLAAKELYDIFGLQNGAKMLKKSFSLVEMRRYEDEIVIDAAEPLISYILSCHGNQNALLLERFKEFSDYVKKRVEGGFHITKDAGIFVGTAE